MKIWMVLAANALALAMLAWPHAVGGLVATVVMMSAIGLGGGWLANRLHERRTRSADPSAAPIGFPSPGLRAGSDPLPPRPTTPRPPSPVEMVRLPSIAEQRASFMALAKGEQDDQVARHLAALKDDGLVRPEYSDLLYAMGVDGEER